VQIVLPFPALYAFLVTQRLMNQTPFQRTAFSHVEKYGDQRQNI